MAAALAAGRGAPGGRPGEIPDRLSPHRKQIAAWLADGLRLTKIHRRLREQGVSVPYSSLHRFAHAPFGFGAPMVTVRVAEPPPGEAAEVDFGRLCFSRYAFLAISLQQDAAAVIDGLESAWVFFGGVVQRLVEDNLKPVVTRADRSADDRPRVPGVRSRSRLRRRPCRRPPRDGPHHAARGDDLAGGRRRGRGQDFPATLASCVGAIPALRPPGTCTGLQACLTPIGAAPLRAKPWMPVLTAVRKDRRLRASYEGIARRKLPEVALVAAMQKLKKGPDGRQARRQCGAPSGRGLRARASSPPVAAAARSRSGGEESSRVADARLRPAAAA